MWSPQHILPSALAPLLLLQLRHHPRFLAVCGVVLATCLFWSTLLSIGLLILACGLLVKNRVRRFLSYQNLLAAPLLAATLALYLTSGKTDFQSGWVWHMYDDPLRMALEVLLFYAVEFLVLALLLWRARPATVRDPFFIASLLILFTAYWLGLPGTQELTKRASLPSVIVLAWFASRAVVHRLPEMSVSRPAMAKGVWSMTGSRTSRVTLAGLVIVLGIGAATACFELKGALADAGVFRYERVGYSVILDLNLGEGRNQRTAPNIPGLLRTLLRDSGDKGGSRGELIIDTDTWDVYIRDNRLIYANGMCDDQFAEEKRRFFLHIYPADKNVLPADRKRIRLYPRGFRRRRPLVCR